VTMVWRRAARFALPVLAVMVLGYVAGKDLALRENARDRAEAAAIR